MPLVHIGCSPHLFFGTTPFNNQLGKVCSTGRPHFRDAMLEGNPGFTVSGFTVSAREASRLVPSLQFQRLRSSKNLLETC